MATSGTIGTTVINTAKILEKAVRRCGLSPQALTPETVETAKEDLYILLLSMTNRGLNLWCIDRKLMPLNAGQATYMLPVGTLAILNLLQATPTRPDYTLTNNTTEHVAEATDSMAVVRWGVQFSTNPTADFTFQTSVDGVVWVTLATVAFADLQTVGLYNWFDLSVKTSARWFRLASLAGATVQDMYLSTNNREISTTPFNRDDYANQPNKNSSSDTVTSYYFEKLVDPQVTVWPVPTDSANHLVLFRHRQLQDIGTLTETIEIPARWVEAVTWQLAIRLAFELPGIDPARRAEVVQMAGSMTMEVESGETDNAPVYFAPNIGVYTR